jgi:hypothetical protein
MAQITPPSVSTDELLEALERDLRFASRAYHCEWDNDYKNSLDEFLLNVKLMQHRISVLLDRWDD